MRSVMSDHLRKGSAYRFPLGRACSNFHITIIASNLPESLKNGSPAFHFPDVLSPRWSSFLGLSKGKDFPCAPTACGATLSNGRFPVTPRPPPATRTPVFLRSAGAAASIPFAYERPASLSLPLLALSAGDCPRCRSDTSLSHGFGFLPPSTVPKA